MNKQDYINASKDLKAFKRMVNRQRILRSKFGEVYLQYEKNVALILSDTNPFNAFRLIAEVVCLRNNIIQVLVGPKKPFQCGGLVGSKISDFPRERIIDVKDIMDLTINR
jgi:hypothetical protein